MEARRRSGWGGEVVGISAPVRKGMLCDSWVTEQMFPQFTHHESGFHKQLKANVSANPLQGSG